MSQSSVIPQAPQDPAKASPAELDRCVKASIRKGREALWELAEALYEFNEATGYLALGYDTLAEWLADPEVGITKSTYYNAVARWREVVVRRQVDSRRLECLDPSKVDEVLPAVKAGRVPIEEALDHVETMPARDLRTAYRSSKRSTPNVGTSAPARVVHQIPEPEPAGEPAEVLADAPDDLTEPLHHEQPEPTTSDDLAEAVAYATSKLSHTGFYEKMEASDRLLRAAKHHLKTCRGP